MAEDESSSHPRARFLSGRCSSTSVDEDSAPPKNLKILCRPELRYPDEELAEGLSCFICFDIMIEQDPVVTICCGKSLCEPCAATCRAMQGTCPNCRSETFHTVPNLALRNIMRSAKVSCFACQAILKGRDEAAAHVELHCPGVEVACALHERGCCWTGRRDAYESHALCCGYTNERSGYTNEQASEEIREQVWAQKMLKRLCVLVVIIIDIIVIVFRHQSGSKGDVCYYVSLVDVGFNILMVLPIVAMPDLLTESVVELELKK